MRQRYTKPRHAAIADKPPCTRSLRIVLADILAGWPLRNQSRYGVEVQQTSVQKQTHLLCPFSLQFTLETIHRPRIVPHVLPLR